MEAAGSPHGVIRFVAARLLQSLMALAILSVVVFILARATGDPLHMILPMSATEEDYDNARALPRARPARTSSSTSPSSAAPSSVTSAPRSARASRSAS